MLERLRIRAIERPVLLVLVQLLKPLDDDNECPQRGGDRGVRAERRGNRDYRGGDQLDAFEHLEPPLILAALGVVPSNLILEPLHGRVAGCGRCGSSGRVHQARLTTDKDWRPTSRDRATAENTLRVRRGRFKS